MKILKLLGSSRPDGNTEYLVNQSLEGVEHTTIRLSDYHIKPIADMRHTAEGFPRVDDDYEKLLKVFLEHDLIIFATPIYWFGMSGQMKVFIDRWSQYMRDNRFPFKERIAQQKAYVVLTGGSDPKITGLPLIQQFGHIFDFVHMSFEDYVIGNAVKPGEIKRDEPALQKMDQWKVQFEQSSEKCEI
ncbi:flavodoxin family protein [Halobacillus yeomjeoni]|uniref:Flavodoxin family protein n=1 Tax=Halobacillus yeomjeoni TaxID=311194 RepID=A0A931HX27_9BACI|nr:flavodoxin family protein [Halobacillus yeomjeoni]MBH0230980.1 flavodoxin family protein [Halobacillus yeomjeoni]